MKHSLKTTILYILLITCCFVGKAQGSYKIAEQDSLALVAFYWATDGPNWKSNQDGFGMDKLSSEWQDVYSGGFNKWLHGPVKDWFGVTVEKFPVSESTDSVYRVIKLWPVLGRRTDGQNNIKGFIPREIGLLSQLRDFRINGNDGFRDTEISDELYHKTLEYIDIESCFFKGDISDKLRTCTNLKKMNFRYNNIDYMPTLDFLTASALSNLNGIQWFYSTQISLAIFEKTIDYFYTISENPKEFPLEMRDVNNVGDETEIVAPLGSAVDLVCNDAGEKEQFITYQWFRNGMSRIGRTKKTYSIANVQAGDYGKYKVRITNDYVKNYDQNSNWGEIFTKEISLVAEPVAPVVLWAKTSYSGLQIQLRMSKTMSDTFTGIDKLEIKADNEIISLVSIASTGRLKRDLLLNLSKPVLPNQEILLSLTSSGITDKNGGVLEPFADKTVVNMAKEPLSFVSATSSKDGAFIDVVFDGFIDPNSITTNNFIISGSKKHQIDDIVLKEVGLDQGFSKTIRIILQNPIDDPDELLNLSYVQGSLSGLYAGSVSNFSNVAIENVVDLVMSEVTLSFFDGSKKINKVVLNGSWLSEPVQLFDDGTNGDVKAGDNQWARTFSLPDDTYSWSVYSRKSFTCRDTIRSIDSETGIETLSVIPNTVHADSLLSNNKNLRFTIDKGTITGHTLFEINNKTIVFRVSIAKATGSVYLMGIDNDWGLGYSMDFDGTYYVDTLTGYSVGDVINYNYRHENKWENVTPDSRQYTVSDGDNIITDVFGIFSSNQSVLFPEDDLTIFYNHLTHQINISGFKGEILYKIFDLSGKVIDSNRMNDLGSSTIQLSSIPNGVYLIALTSPDKNFLRVVKFLINNI